MYNCYNVFYSEMSYLYCFALALLDRFPMMHFVTKTEPIIINLVIVKLLCKFEPVQPVIQGPFS